MNSIKRLWTAISNLAAGIERLAGLAHQSADALEENLHLKPELPALSNGQSDGPRIVKARK